MQSSPLRNEEKGEHLIHVLGQGQVMILDMEREEGSTNMPQTPKENIWEQGLQENHMQNNNF